MTLPTQVVDRLLARLAATYGASWDRSMGSAPIEDVRAVWASELGNFGNRLQDLAWALENLPERCPNVIEFRAIARRAPEPAVPRLPEVAADAERVRAELEKLAPKVKAARTARVDPKAWARAIVLRHEHGDKVSPISLRFAREALGAFA